MPSLHVTLVQEASTLDPEQNRATLERHLEEQQAADLVVFPEAFMRDFGPPGSDISPFAESLDGPFVTTLVELARRHGTTVVAGMFETSADPARPYNTLVVAGPDGLRASYRKIHLYDSFGYKESDRLLAGDPEPVLVEVGGMRIGLMTCYDLRFPELARALVTRGADALVVPAAWVAGPLKVEHWRTLVRARAIENTTYVAAAAQPAPRYSGHSMVASPHGEVVAEAGEGAGVVHATLETKVIGDARAQNPSLANRRF